jgi:ATP-binding cassette, subfamily C (CFTR/MRP), member 1
VDKVILRLTVYDAASGKSSLILTFLRLLELKSGEIYIDGVDLSTLPREEIRTRLTALPQDPLLLPSTVRHNLEPHGHITDDEPLIQVLQKTSIWDIIRERGGLDAAMDGLGLSVGQQQLFCLARAMLHKKKVLLLDESTSSVDRQTAEEIREIVKAEFSDCTVIEVAHRLDAIQDADVVVVMAKGEVLEVGNPKELLSKQSHFKNLWDDQGM